MLLSYCTACAIITFNVLPTIVIHVVFRAEFEIPCNTVSEMNETSAVQNFVCNFILTYFGYLNTMFALILINLNTT